MARGHDYLGEYSDVDPREQREFAGAGALAAVAQKAEEAKAYIESLRGFDMSQPYDERTAELLDTLDVLTDWNPLNEWEAEQLVQTLVAYINHPQDERDQRAWDLHNVFDTLMRKRSQVGGHGTLVVTDMADAERIAAATAAIERVTVLDRADQAARSAQSSLERIQDLERAARVATGNVSAFSLSVDYELRADREATTANMLRVLAITLMVAAAAIVIFTPIGNDLSGPELFRRLAFSVPALVLSGYLARESAQHRYLSRELGSTALRLRTLWGFAEGLPDEQLRAVFLDRVGSAIFTSPTAQPGRDPDSSSKDAEGLLRQLVDLLRAAGLPR